MNAKRITWIILFLIWCLSIAEYTGEVRAMDNNVTAKTKDCQISEDTSGYPVIGYLKKRDRVITIKKGPGGPLYTVETKDGKILGANLPADILCAEFPDLKSLIEKGMAVEDAAYRQVNPGVKSIDIQEQMIK